MSSRPAASAPPATEEWPVNQLQTIRPGAGLGPLLQRRTTPTLSPGQVARRDLARYYLLIGADKILTDHARALLLKTADMPQGWDAADITIADMLELVELADQMECDAALVAVPAVSPFLPPAE